MLHREKGVNRLGNILVCNRCVRVSFVMAAYESPKLGVIVVEGFFFLVMFPFVLIFLSNLIHYFFSVLFST